MKDHVTRRRRNLYFSLTAMRFRFYVTESGNLFLRHWQWFLLVGLFIPGFPILPVFKIPGHVFAAIASSSLRSRSRAELLLAIQVVQLLWILPQIRPLRGGTFRPYAETLPIARPVRNSVTLTLLVIADSLTLIPATYGFFQAVPPAGGLALFRFLAWSAVISNFLLLQLGMVERYEIVSLATIIVVWPLSIALMIPASLEAWLLLLLAISCPVAALWIPDRFHARFRARVQVVSRIKELAGSQFLGRIPSPLRVQLKALGERPVLSCATLCAAIGVAEGVDALLPKFSYDGRSLPAVITGMSVTALIISGLYRRLRQAHASARNLWSTLPIRRNFWAVNDVLLLMSLSFIPLIMLLYPLIEHGLASALMLFELGAGYLVLLPALRVTAAKGGRFSVMSSVALAVAWASSAIAEVVR